MVCKHVFTAYAAMQIFEVAFSTKRSLKCVENFSNFYISFIIYSYCTENFITYLETLPKFHFHSVFLGYEVGWKIYCVYFQNNLMWQYFSRFSVRFFITLNFLAGVLDSKTFRICFLLNYCFNILAATAINF